VALDSATQSISLQDPDWSQKLASCKASSVVHLAGITHNRNPENEIQKVNVDGSRALGKEAARNGVKRFIFLSSIQTIAKNTANDRAVNSNTSAIPLGAYGGSKLEAEQLLRGISMESRMEVVVLRAPLVYGPEVKANFRNLFQLVGLGIHLPLSVLDSNQRSFVGIDNLVHFIVTCLKHPTDANETFLVSDGEDLSTPDLIRRMPRSFAKKGVRSRAANGPIGRAAPRSSRYQKKAKVMA